jgi:diketogulonate reductase-like aldo/keto reductase
MGERGNAAKAETAAIKLGIELGMTLIDTAEMYGNGGAEEVVADASQGQRDKLFIVSKVYPHNASRTGVPAACERSLKRLRTDRIDLYLLHCRGIEYDLLPWCSEHKIPLMAYSPVGQGGRLLQSKALAAVAKRHDATPAQIAIAWSMWHGNVITIPKASDPRHVRENAAAGAIALTAEDLAAIDAVHPPPGRKQSLDVS